MTTNLDHKYHQLPVEVKNLIYRKLRHQQREQEMRWVSTAQAAYTKLRDSVLEGLSTGQINRVFPSRALDIYAELVTAARDITNEWPKQVWGTIESILDKANVATQDSEELISIIDKFCWTTESHPFTLNYIDSKRYEGILQRLAERYTLITKDCSSPLHIQLDLAAAAAHCDIFNNSRVALEEIYIAIIEYTISKQHDKPDHSNNDESPKPNFHPLAVFQEMEKLKFEEIKIRIDPENLVLRVSARGKEATAPFSSICITKKNEITLNKQGEVFMAMANGTLNVEATGIKRAIIHLSKFLREAFDTTDPPFQKNKQKFQLSIPKDKRAKQHAVRRTKTYNDSRMVNSDTDAQAFFEAHDTEYNPDDTLYAEDPDLGAGD